MASSQQFENTPILDALRARIGQYNNQSPSPMGVWLNGKLLAVEPGSLTMSYQVRPEMANPGGILHGGACAAMLDDVIGMTVYSLNRPQFFATIQFNLDYLSAAPVGAEVIAQSQLLRAGKTAVYAQCELRTPEGKLLTRASSHLIASPFERRPAEPANASERKESP